MAGNYLIKFWTYLSRRLKQNQLMTHAAALSFSSVLAVIPMVALAYFSFSVLGGFSKVEALIESYMFENIAPSFAENLKGYLYQIKENVSAKAMGLFGLAAFSFTSIVTISKIEKSLNTIWGIKRSRNIFKKGILYWGLLTLAPLLLGASFYLSTKMVAVLRIDGLGGIGQVFSGTILPAVFSGVAFSSLYWLLPNFKVRKRAAFLSGFCTALVFEIAKQLYSYYAAIALGNSFYGSLAVMPVFLLWLYVAWLIVLMGAEFCVWVQYQMEGGSWDVAGETYHPILLVDLLQRVHNQNERNGHQTMTYPEMVKEYDVAPEELLRHLGWLERNEVIMSVKKSGEESYCYAPFMRDKTKNLERFLEKFANVDYPAKEEWAVRLKEHFYQVKSYD